MRSVALFSVLAVAWCTSAAHAQFVVDADTVSLWHLDDGFSITATDAGPAGFDLIFDRYPLDGSDGSALPTWQTTGCFGEAVALVQGDSTGSGGYLHDAGSHAFAQNELTVELWLRTTTRVGMLFWGGFVQLQFWLDFDGKPRLYIGDENDWSEPAISAVAVDDGQWHYVVGSYDGATVRVFVDGVEQGSAAFAGVVGTMTNFYVGGRPFNTFFEGSIDEVRLSDAARSGESIADAYEALATLCPEPATALLTPCAAAALLGLKRQR